jgi:hypothetical protein
VSLDVITRDQIASSPYGETAHPSPGVINIVIKGGVARPDVTSTFGLSKGSFRGNRCTPAGLACTEGQDIDFSDGGLFDLVGSGAWPPAGAV